ncbi:hypothetical protein [Clostridium sp. M14]|uniref:hypothetical protein n=1 Tax=Clostridium sp. M14 TaxID=2716311 RepID=UPI001CCFC01D|nr:hypothetical protein [Clostridium sp. M14]MBZ9691639.1 hypothetical protein [Clostridium sp. M14]
MATKNIEIQDSDGNIYYPHTNASVVKNGSTTVAEQLKDIANDSYPIVEATGTNIYVGSTARITKLSKGTRCTLFVATDSTGNCSLNLNNYGAKNIKDSFGNIVNNIKANIPYNLCYNGLDFILQGKGGGGNLIPKYLLQGYYGDGDNGRIDGSMVNRGAPVVSLNCGGTFNLQEGYYSGGQAIANSLASQTPGTATADKIMQGLTAWVNGSKINGNATLESLGGKLLTTGNITASQGELSGTVNINFRPNLIFINMIDNREEDSLIVYNETILPIANTSEVYKYTNKIISNEISIRHDVINKIKILNDGFEYNLKLYGGFPRVLTYYALKI